MVSTKAVKKSDIIVILQIRTLGIEADYLLSFDQVTASRDSGLLQVIPEPWPPQ